MAIEVGAKLEGKVTGIKSFGAFIDLVGGGTGLVHISEIADNYVKDVNDHLKLDDVVTVKVINIDKDGKVGLSIKQAVDRPEGSVAPQRERSSESSGRERFSSNKPAGQGGSFNRGGSGGGGGRPFNKPNSSRPTFAKPSFEDKMSRFLKDSEERISSLKKNTEGKRGGRGAKRV